MQALEVPPKRLKAMAQRSARRPWGTIETGSVSIFLPRWRADGRLMVAHLLASRVIPTVTDGVMLMDHSTANAS